MEDVIDRKRYYLCTFKVIGEEMGYYSTMAMDCHPVDYMLDRSDLILINHIEITREQFDKRDEVVGLKPYLRR